MQKKITNLLIIALLITCLTGCQVKEVKEIKEDLKPDIKYNKKVDDTTITFTLSSDWNYEELSLEDGSKLIVKIFHNSQDKSFTLNYYDHPVGFCGTGRNTLEIELNNNQKAIIGYELGEDQWSDLSFPDINPNIVLINNGVEEKEALEIIKTITISKAD